jgi:hypothetical protein
MLTISWERLDKFYIALIVILALLAILVIVTFRGLFSAYLTAYEINQQDLDAGVRVDKEKLEEAYTFAFTKRTLPLQIR